MKTSFEFEDAPQASAEDYVLRIPPGIRSKSSLLAALSSAGQFPDYFGANWDALLDCFRDLSWIKERTVLVVHSDVPLQNSPTEFSTYLEILKTAQADWLSTVNQASVELQPEWPYVEHEIRVVFPAGAVAVVSAHNSWADQQSDATG